MNCSGSVGLCEIAPKRTSKWALEGTQAHEVLEAMLSAMFVENTDIFAVKAPNDEMWDHGSKAASFLRRLHQKNPFSEFLIETKIYLDFIHPEMFGTFDSAVVDHFGTLHVFDYKYGAGKGVSPVRNLQMIFYGIGLAHRYGWNFKRVRLWIIQPRIPRYTGPVYWEVPILELKNKWVPVYIEGVERVEKYPNKFVEGAWCHWCDAKGICPLKKESRGRQAALVFGGRMS